jgi:16S rRNA (cytosine1402-N4)-methyltransferase
VKQVMKVGLRDGLFSEISEGPITATPEERRMNPRSSSAKLRWLTKA